MVIRLRFTLPLPGPVTRLRLRLRPGPIFPYVPLRTDLHVCGCYNTYICCYLWLVTHVTGSRWTLRLASVHTFTYSHVTLLRLLHVGVAHTLRSVGRCRFVSGSVYGYYTLLVHCWLPAFILRCDLVGLVRVHAPDPARPDLRVYGYDSRVYTFTALPTLFVGLLRTRLILVTFPTAVTHLDIPGYRTVVDSYGVYRSGWFG